MHRATSAHGVIEVLFSFYFAIPLISVNAKKSDILSRILSAFALCVLLARTIGILNVCITV